MQKWEEAFYDKSKELEMMMVDFNDNHPCGGSEQSRSLEKALVAFCRSLKNEKD